MHQIFEMEQNVPKLFLRQIPVDFPFGQERFLFGFRQRPAVVGRQIDRSVFCPEEEGTEGYPLEGSCNTKGPLLVIFLELQPVSATRTHNSSTPKRRKGEKPHRTAKRRSSAFRIAPAEKHRRGKDNTIHSTHLVMLPRAIPGHKSISSLLDEAELGNPPRRDNLRIS